MRAKGIPKGNNKERHEQVSSGSDGVDAIQDGTTSLRSTGKGAKKRRAGIIVEDATDADEEDDEDDK